MDVMPWMSQVVVQQQVSSDSAHIPVEEHEITFSEIAAILNSSTGGNFYFLVHLEDHFVTLYVQHNQDMQIFVIDSLSNNQASAIQVRDALASEGLDIPYSNVHSVIPGGGIQADVGYNTCGVIAIVFAMYAQWYAEHSQQVQGQDFNTWISLHHAEMIQNARVLMLHAKHQIQDVCSF